MSLDRERFLAPKPLKTERVPIPEWGDEAILAVLPGRAREAFELWLHKNGETPETMARLVMLAVVGEDGQRYLTEADVQAINDADGVVLARLFRAAMRLNRIGDTEVEALKGN